MWIALEAVHIDFKRKFWLLMFCKFTRILCYRNISNDWSKPNMQWKFMGQKPWEKLQEGNAQWERSWEGPVQKGGPRKETGRSWNQFRQHDPLLPFVRQRASHGILFWLHQSSLLALHRLPPQKDDDQKPPNISQAWTIVMPYSVSVTLSPHRIKIEYCSCVGAYPAWCRKK